MRTVHRLKDRQISATQIAGIPRLIHFVGLTVGDTDSILSFLSGSRDFADEYRLHARLSGHLFPSFT
jgi:hypothetical protein